MLLNNEVATGSSRESGSSFGGEGRVDGRVGYKEGFNIPKLSKLDIDAQGGFHGEKQKKVVGVLVCVNTKSRVEGASFFSFGICRLAILASCSSLIT